MWIIGTILLILVAVCLLFQIVTLLIVVFRSKWHPVSSIYDWYDEGVTILRPVSGLENNLERTLTSAFILDHPKKEIIFCVARDNDPVIPLVKKLMEQYSDVSAKLLIGDDPISDNPKLNNLVKGWRAAQYDFVVMTDSNVLMPHDYIALLFARFKEDTGLVTSPPLGTEADNFAADIEAAFLNSYQARWQLCSDTIGNGFAQGKTLFWRRRVLDNAGGIEVLSREMAEDAAATKVVRSQGFKVRLSAMPFAQPLGEKKIQPVWARQVRWAKLRRDSFAAFFYLEIISGSVFPLLCLFLAACCGVVSFMSLLWFALFWYGIEFATTAYVGWPISLRQCIAIICRDVLLIAVWFSAFGKGGYSWQGHKVEIGKK